MSEDAEEEAAEETLTPVRAEVDNEAGIAEHTINRRSTGCHKTMICKVILTHRNQVG